MLEGKASIKETDMPVKMQVQAMASASQALDLYDVVDSISIATHIKKVTFFFSFKILKTLHTFLGICGINVQNQLFLNKIMNKLKTIYLQEFDKIYGGGWQCVVGSNFGCYFTHKHGTFIYFSLETLNFLIFKAAITPSS